MPRTPTIINEPFAELVARLLDGMSRREAGRVTGVGHSYIDDLVFGQIPSYAVLQRIADGLGISPADRCELFRLAGYRGEETRELRRLLAGLRALGLEGLPDDAPCLSPETVDAVLAAVAAR